MAAFSGSSSEVPRSLTNEGVYKILTCNVAGYSDYQNLMLANPQLIRNPEIQRIALARLNDPQNVTGEEFCAFEAHAAETYNKLSQEIFHSILSDLSPDILCLQEFAPRFADHKGIEQELVSKNYTVTRTNGTNIAYNAQRFTEISNTSIRGGSQVLNLRDRTTGIVLRVVSDHIGGFNAKTRKDQTEIAKNGSTEEEKAEARTAKNNGEAVSGDNSLRTTLQKIEVDVTEQKTKVAEYEQRVADHSTRYLASIRNYFRPFVEEAPSENAHAPTVIIFAGDFNATAKYVSDEKSSRLHPRRVQTMLDAGYECDKTDKSPTIIDINLKTGLKYDYIFAKALKADKEVIIASRPLDEVRQEDGSSLQIGLDFNNYFSDHLPVFATVTVVDA